ncbi:hypothetical protein TNIN_465211 [Trichonephila inaurata madagascariensis]|uniref:Uncharacterized protein n=1 Tax=Trichonephila inaurata madagascariensis TaxID=2747483 RepID=A0A8X7CRS3_9ARAC|nr:hypothetical protein TNIN_465211 [Trichonephila inaurata madagascariensis]
MSDSRRITRYQEPLLNQGPSISKSSGSMISDPPVLSACQKKSKDWKLLALWIILFADHRIILENEKGLEDLKSCRSRTA